MPDLPHLAVRLGGGRAVPRRRRGAAQAEERQRAFRREREGACELTLCLRRTPSLEQQLTEQLMRRLHVGRRPELGRHPVLEDRMPAEFGPPPDVKPAHELFGELLLEAGRAAEAQREFARALALAPKRALSLLGLGRAAAAAGDRATAAQAYREVREIWHRADPGLPGLAEASRSVGAP